MHRISLAAVLLAAAPLVAQSRTTALVGAPMLGMTFHAQHVVAPMAAGQLAGFLWSWPFAGAVPVVAPGLTVNGLLRVDQGSLQLLGLQLTDGVNAPQMSISVPALLALVGAQLDCQSFDIDAAGTIELASNDATATLVAGPSAALNMVPIAPGTFMMGSWSLSSNEQPVHQVTLTRQFWMGKYEVTQAEYQSVVGSNPSYFQGSSYPSAPQQPVEQVSWDWAVAYCQALTAIEQAAGRVPQGYQYRLPTEAEWEYCCRAGTTTEWNTGMSLSTSQANFDNALGQGNAPGRTAVVGSYAPNAFGLHDMHGNVCEWCLDSYALYAAGPVTDPFVTGGYLSVIHGGSWNQPAADCRSAKRYGNGSGYAGNYIVGFRVALAPVLVP